MAKLIKFDEEVKSCYFCGATVEEIEEARDRGDARFYLHCGCDNHGDHLGCSEECQDYFGCDAKLNSEEDIICDHS